MGAARTAFDPKRIFGELLRSANASSHDRALRTRENILCHHPEPFAQFRMFEMRAALGRLTIAPIEPGDTGDELARGEQRLRRGACGSVFSTQRLAVFGSAVAVIMNSLH